MPNIKSKKDRVKTNARDTEHNKVYKSKIRSSVKKLSAALEEGKTEELITLQRATEQILDKAAGKNVIHKKKASRTKSRLDARVKAAIKE
jgi:small subunit ribosomal protein S20